MVGLQLDRRFTHGIEAVLEKIRSGSLVVDSDIITTLLEARDHLAAMVEGEAAGSPVPASGDLSQRLSDLLKGTESRSSHAATASVRSPEPRRDGPPPQPTAGPGTVCGIGLARGPERPDRQEGTPPAEPEESTNRRREATPARSRRKSMDHAGEGSPPGSSEPPPASGSPEDSHPAWYRITLALGTDTLRRGVNPLGVLDELRELGSCTIVTDPEACRFSMTLIPNDATLSGPSPWRPTRARNG